MVSIFFYFHPYLGKWSNLKSIFFKQRGRNHQLEVVFPLFVSFCWLSTVWCSFVVGWCPDWTSCTVGSSRNRNCSPETAKKRWGNVVHIYVYRMDILNDGDAHVICVILICNFGCVILQSSRLTECFSVVSLYAHHFCWLMHLTPFSSFFRRQKRGSFFRTQDVVPTIKAAVTESPLKLWWVGLLYAVQNLLYFVCLQYTSAAAYQVLSAMAGFDMYFFQLKRISTKKKNKTCSTSTFPRVSTYLHILYRELTYPTWQKGK